jgi:hypothetical protein
VLFLNLLKNLITRSNLITMLWLLLAPRLNWIIFSKNLSFRPLCALATHTLVIVAQNNIQSLSKTKTITSFESKLPTRSSTQKLIPISHHGHYLQSFPFTGSKSLTIARDWNWRRWWSKVCMFTSLDVLSWIPNVKNSSKKTLH